MNKFKRVDIIKSEEKKDRFLALSICSIVAMYILTLCVIDLYMDRTNWFVHMYPFSFHLGCG